MLPSLLSLPCQWLSPVQSHSTPHTNRALQCLVLYSCQSTKNRLITFHAIYVTVLHIELFTFLHRKVKNPCSALCAVCDFLAGHSGGDRCCYLRHVYVLWMGFLSKDLEWHNLTQQVQVVVLNLAFNFAQVDSPAVSGKSFQWQGKALSRAEKCMAQYCFKHEMILWNAKKISLMMILCAFQFVSCDVM